MVLRRRHWLFLVIPLIMLVSLTACERPLASNDSQTAEESAEATAVAETAEAENADEADAEAENVDEADAEAESADEADAEAESADEADAEAESAEEADAEAESADEGADEAESGGDSETGDEAAEPDEAESEADAAEEAGSSDPNVGGGTPETAEEEGVTSAPDGDADEADTEDMASDEAASGEDAMTEADGDADEQAAGSEDDAEAASDEPTEDEAAAAADSEDTAAEETAMEEAAESTEAVEAESSTTLPATHTVQPGENLYRIGLKYGMSWVTLAAYNHLPNANYIRVGQVLQIPGGSTPSPVPPPTTPDEAGYTNYVVQRGDTLNSIGRKFGVSWVEIAEANGIVNPNLIYAGQVLKIPTSEPETPPSLTHTVKQGETLYRISLQYGVNWLSIAQANKIAPPYVIYPGQVLAIPSG